MTRTPPEPLDVEFGARVRQARVVAGLSHDQVAAQIGMSRPSMCNIEAGRHPISLRLAAQLAAVLKTDVAALVGEGAVPLEVLAALAAGQREMMALMTRCAEIGDRVAAVLDEWEL